VSTAKAAANAIALVECLAVALGDVVEALRRWDPDQLEMGERLRVYGQRLGNRSQFGG
jgi:2,6-dihydroxypyridine 3-monooxygenase